MPAARWNVVSVEARRPRSNARSGFGTRRHCAGPPRSFSSGWPDRTAAPATWRWPKPLRRSCVVVPAHWAESRRDVPAAGGGTGSDEAAATGIAAAAALKQTHQWLEKQSRGCCTGVHHFLVTFTVPRECGSVLRIHQRAGYEALLPSQCRFAARCGLGDQVTARFATRLLRCPAHLGPRPEGLSSARALRRAGWRSGARCPRQAHRAGKPHRRTF